MMFESSQLGISAPTLFRWATAGRKLSLFSGKNKIKGELERDIILFHKQKG